MTLSKLTYAKGSRKKTKRVGRGPGSGHGATSCRGHKGYRSRSGGRVALRMEGGQTPYFRRFPKRGFTNIFKTKFQIVNVGDLGLVEENNIDIDMMLDYGLIRSAKTPVKVLGDGEISSEKEISANAFSKSAVSKIESAGGKAVVL